MKSPLQSGCMLGVFALGLAGAGCSMSGTDASKDLVAAFCGKAAECCTAGELRALLGPYTTAADCADRVLAYATENPKGFPIFSIPRVGASLSLPNLTYVDAAIRDKRLKVDEDMLHLCTDKTNGLVCVLPAVVADTNCKPTDPTVGCDPSKVFVGQVAVGGHCLTRTAGFPGVEECAAGLYCLDTGDDGVCVAYRKKGETCYASADCDVGLFCYQIDGTCQPKRKLGETCAFDDSAQTDKVTIPCEDLLTCDPFSRVCVDQCQRGHRCSSDFDCDKNQGLRCILNYCDTVRQQGQPCAQDLDCPATLRCEVDPTGRYASACVPKLANNAPGCLADADCQSGFCDPTGGPRTCRAQVSPPAACPSTLNAQCAGGYCTAGFCVGLVADGGACQQDAWCQSGVCVSQMCAHPPLASGATCSSNSQCTSAFCNFETVRKCDTKPLDNGKRCQLAPSTVSGLTTTCRSGACANGLCADGLAAGADCTPAPGKAPCAPTLYCDSTLAPQGCLPRHGPGDDCTASAQCYGTCSTVAERMICDSTPPPGGLVCDGNGGQP